jgi:hypothetical protein
MNPIIQIIGPKRSGKDTVGEILRHAGYNPCSYSLFCTEKVMMPYFASKGVLWISPEACYNARDDFRQEWYDEIRRYHGDELHKVTSEMITEDYDCLIGIRHPEEFTAGRHLIDIVVWVDASTRIQGIEESDPTMNISRDNADYVISNNGDLEDLHTEVLGFLAYIESQRIANDG